MEESTPDRKREHPGDRFARSQQEHNLHETIKRLQAQPSGGVAGHRQETLYKHGSITVALFLFGANARLAPHRTKGTVIIQVLAGHMLINAEGTTHDLRSGGLLVLTAGVEHEVIAKEESQMMLTVNLSS